MFCSTNLDKTRGNKFFEIVHWPFKLPPNQHQPAGPSGWIYQCMSAQPSKGQCSDSKNFLPLVLVIKVVQNLFFPATYNASTFLSLDSRCVQCISHQNSSFCSSSTIDDKSCESTTNLRPRARTDASALLGSNSTSTITLESNQDHSDAPNSPKNLKKLTAAIR